MPRACKALFGRRESCPAVIHLRVAQRRLREMRCAAIDGLPVDERVARNCGHRVDVMRVSVIEIVVVVDDAHVAKRRVMDIDIRDETVAAMEPRMEWLAPAQREPAHSATPATAKTETKAKAAAEEAYERRAIDWIGADRSWAPTP